MTGNVVPSKCPKSDIRYCKGLKLDLNLVQCLTILSSLNISKVLHGVSHMHAYAYVRCAHHA